jgi:DNA-binding CsgD family transcriptional regulator
MPAQPRISQYGPGLTRQRDVSLEDLLLPLIQRLATSDTISAQDKAHSDAEEIMLDFELDGWRYMLIRTVLPSNSLVQLSPREQEIVRMVAEGHPNKVIAAILNISSWTVGTHLRRIFAKFGVGSRAAMVARYLEVGKTAAPSHSTPTNRRSAASLSAHREVKGY